jgi:hypothetical protein
MPLVEPAVHISWNYKYVGVKQIARIEERLAIRIQLFAKEPEDGFRNFCRKGSKAVLLRAQEDVRVALTLTLAPLKLGHADLRCLFFLRNCHLSARGEPRVSKIPRHTDIFGS